MEREERLDCLDNLPRHIAPLGRFPGPGPATGLSARRPRPWTIRRSSPPPRHLTTARMIIRCSSRFAAAAVALNWPLQDRPSLATGRITPFPTALMTTARAACGSPAGVRSRRSVHGRRRSPAAVPSRAGTAHPACRDPNRRRRREFLARWTEESRESVSLRCANGLTP